jgi:transcription initiation factor TFIIF subunit beta
MPRDDLLNLLFNAFSKEDYWTLRALSDFTQQPLTWLKDVLLEIAILNKRGPYSGMYELKAEYKNQ